MKILPDTQKRGSKLILFSVILYPVLVVLFLDLVFPRICRSADTYFNYYILTSVTLISLIPFLLGAAVVTTHGEKPGVLFGSGKDKHASWLAPIKWSVLFALIGFGIILPVIFLTDAVPSEGWLRSIFAAAMLGLAAPVVILRLYLLKRTPGSRMLTFIVFVLMIISVPLGLVLHHPWNYFLFYSPLYWISWSWVIPSPWESLLYGLIGVAILLALMLTSLRSLLKILKQF